MISEASAPSSSGREREIEGLEHILEGEHTRVLCIVGESGVGKTRLANAIVARITGQYDYTVSVYLPPQGLLNSAEDLLLSSLLNQLLPVVPRYLSPEALLNEVFSFVASNRTLCLIDNAESLPPAWLAEFVRRWSNIQDGSVLILTAPRSPLPQRDSPGTRAGITYIHQLSGLSSSDKALILDLLGEPLCARFSQAKLLTVASRLRNVPQKLLYLRWLEPRTLAELYSVAERLKDNLELPDLVGQVVLKSKTSIVPFLAMGRIRAVRFDEALLASLWDRLGGASVQAYIRSRDSLVRLGVLYRTSEAPEVFYLNPAVHVHLEKYVSRELAPEQLAQIEYHMGEYYRGLFLNSPYLMDADALNEFVYHSARARNLETATRFVIEGGWLEDLRREGQALGVRRLLVSARTELQDASERETSDEGSKSLKGLLGGVELELAHALCDLSEYLEALDALSRADSFTPVTNEGAAAFHEMIGFRRGVCLGDSGKLEEAAFAYLSTVESAMRSRRVSRISVAALGYAAMVLGYLQQPAAQPLGALSVQFAERLGNPSLLARNRCSYAQLLSYLGAVDDANELVRIAETSIRSVPAIQQDRRELGRVLIAKASTSLAMDDLTGARNAVGEAFAINTQLGDRRRMARTEAFAGVIEMREGNQDESSRILMKSLNALVDVGDMLNVLLCCFTLAFADGFQSADEAIEHGAANGSVQHPYGWGEILKDCMRSGYPVRSIASFWDTCYRTRILGLH